MTAPRIVTPEEAQEAWDRWRSGLTAQVYMHGVDLAHTVATEPDRTRAAVVKALRQTADSLGRSGYPSSCYFMRARADAIENGAPL